MRANIFINVVTVKLFSNPTRVIVAFFVRMAPLSVRQNKLANVVIKLNGKELKMISKNVKRFLLIAPLLVLLVLATGFLYWYNPNLNVPTFERKARELLEQIK